MGSIFQENFLLSFIELLFPLHGRKKAGDVPVLRYRKTARRILIGPSYKNKKAEAYASALEFTLLVEGIHCR